MDTKIEKISPKKASEYLEQNFSNRPISKAEVKRYVRLIQTGKFHLTHQGIAFDKEGRLRDGQTRLTAIVEAKQPVTMSVSRNLDEAAVVALDAGMRRTDAQALSMSSGAVVSGFVAAIAREMYAGGAHLGTEKKATMPHRVELVEFFSEHRDVIHSVWQAFRNNSAGVGTSYILAALARAMYHLNKKRVLRFAEVLAAGYAEPGEKIIIQLRNHILNKRKQESRNRAVRDDLYAKVEQTLFDWVKEIPTKGITKTTHELFPLPHEKTASEE